MELHVMQRHRMVDQENVYVSKENANIVRPAKHKKQGLTIRGALGDLSTNVQAQREVNTGKVAVATAELEKKATLCRGPVKSNYSHVQPKVDTGLSGKIAIQPSSKPPLRREESTAGLAARAAARTRATLKETSKSTDMKESVSIYIQTKKMETKKTNKLPTVKENREVKTLKPILKESTESLGKLKLEEKSNTKSNKSNDCHKLQASLQKPMDDALQHVLDTTPVLPEDIEDIDSENNSPLLMSVYIKDIYRYLTQLEDKYPIEPDYLKKQMFVTGKMRATLLNWLVEVQRQFSLVLETFHLSVGIVDRYLQAVPNVQKSKIQLVGVSAMLIASKYEEIYSPEVGDFVYITDKAYTKEEVLQCEREILSKLGFCLARPIPLSFLRRFTKAAHGTAKIHHLAKYLVDLSLIEYAMAHYRPSELAAAAICLSSYLLSSKDLEDIWTPTMSHYSGYTLEHIDPIIKKIAQIVVNVENSKNKAVYHKYQEPALAKVANLPQLKGELIFELANSIPMITLSS